MSSESETELTRQEKRRIQLREAQKRYYATHKKKEKPEIPASYQVEHLRNYHKSYYEKNKDKINQRAKERYNNKKKAKIQEAIQDIPNLPPTEPVQSIELILPSEPIVIERTTYNC